MPETEARPGQPLGEDEDGTEHRDEALVASFVDALLAVCERDLRRVLLEADTQRHIGVPVSLIDIASRSPSAAEALLSSPRHALPLLERALITAQERLRESMRETSEAVTVKLLARVRLHGLPQFGGGDADATVSPTLGLIRASHINQLVTVQGTVVRTGPVQMLQGRRGFVCAKCKHSFVVEADLESGGVLRLPSACPSAAECPGTVFKPRAEDTGQEDYQEIRVQERSGALSVGAPLRTMTVVLQADLVDAVVPGDDVEVTGIVLRRWKGIRPGARCELDLVLQALHVAVATVKQGAVTVTEDDAAAFEAFWERHKDAPLKGRDAILRSVCPQIFGLASVKLATLLCIIGGVPSEVEGHGRVRGEIHMLLVGDPGTGKSQFLKSASRLAPRAVLTSGGGSSAAGLTASAVRDGSQWALEAGALVMADGGVCCVDEFGQVPAGDRVAVHECMEQQTLSVAKAGLVVTLPTRTTVFAITNPRGSALDPSRDLVSLTGISGPLLSRFDVVLVLLDGRVAQRDVAISTHVLKAHQRAAAGRAGAGVADRDGAGSPGPGPGSTGASGELLWTHGAVRKYVAWCKRLQPSMSPEAEEVVKSYYLVHRQQGDREKARTTIRMLESVVRLAQAHARLMGRAFVTVQDAVWAVVISESQRPFSILLGDTGRFRGDLPADPDRQYLEIEAKLLRAIDLELGRTGGLLEGPEVAPGTPGAGDFGIGGDRGGWREEGHRPGVAEEARGWGRGQGGRGDAGGTGEGDGVRLHRWDGDGGEEAEDDLEGAHSPHKRWRGGGGRGNSMGVSGWPRGPVEGTSNAEGGAAEVGRPGAAAWGSLGGTGVVTPRAPSAGGSRASRDAVQAGGGRREEHDASLAPTGGPKRPGHPSAPPAPAQPPPGWGADYAFDFV